MRKEFHIYSAENEGTLPQKFGRKQKLHIKIRLFLGKEQISRVTGLDRAVMEEDPEHER